MGPYAGVEYNSPYFIVNYVVSYPPPTAQGKGWSWEDLSYRLSTYVCLLILKTTNKKERVRRRERKWVRGDLLSTNRHFMEHGHWTTPCLSDFNPAP
jgi:hypothetical protein